MPCIRGLKRASLELEVLETSALQDLVQTSQVLQACREIGVPVALDDFGTGYSSLTYLKRLPAGILKIDHSFVSDMLDDPEDLTILEGLLGLAAAFRRQVIAEGVETVDHGLMLLQMGCELAQGYGIARPMPAGDLQAWVAAWLPDPRWADVPLVNADNRAVLHASVEHRAWLAAFEACLEGRRADPAAARSRPVPRWRVAQNREAVRARQAAGLSGHRNASSAVSCPGSGDLQRAGRGPQRGGLGSFAATPLLTGQMPEKAATFARNGSGKDGKRGFPKPRRSGCPRECGVDASRWMAAQARN